MASELGVMLLDGSTGNVVHSYNATVKPQIGDIIIIKDIWKR